MEMTLIHITKYVPDKETEEALIETYRSGHLVQGLQVQQFETMFSDISGSKHAVAVSNGTVALRLMLTGKDIWGMDEYVITNPLSFIATARAIEHVGAIPFFVDVDPHTGLLDEEKVDDAIETIQQHGSRAIVMPVDLHGQFDPVSVPDGVMLLRDSCQAHGIQFVGDAAAYSFHASKNATSGEGGMILTDDDELAHNLRLLRNHGMSEPYVFDHNEGFNARMTDLQAVVGIGSLKKLKQANEKRTEIAHYYTDVIEDREKFETPPNQNVWHHYMLRHPKRDEIVTILRYEGIDARVYYPQILPDILEEHDGDGWCENARQICDTSFAIPVHEHLTDGEIDHILETLNKAANSVK